MAGRGAMEAVQMQNVLQAEGTGRTNTVVTKEGGVTLLPRGQVPLKSCSGNGAHLTAFIKDDTNGIRLDGRIRGEVARGAADASKVDVPRHNRSSELLPKGRILYHRGPRTMGLLRILMTGQSGLDGRKTIIIRGQLCRNCL
jgi:hypothetical protein